MTSSPPPPQQFGSQPAGAHPSGSAAPRSSRDGFFGALFDLKFERFITLRFARVIYVICIVMAVLSWLGTILSAILAATAQSALMSYASYYSGMDAGMGAGGVLMIVAAVLLGWIPSLLMVICSRIILEFIVASVRTATNTQALVDRGVR